MSALGCSCGRLRCPLCHTERPAPGESAARAEVRRLAAAYRERRDDIIRRGYPKGESWDDAWVPLARAIVAAGGPWG